MSRKLYTEEKERMEAQVSAHKRMVWTSIKITFIAFTALLLTFLISLIISLIAGGAGKTNEPPTFVGPPNNVVIGYVGDKPVYKTWVKAVDDKDESVKIDVDNSQVNINAEGEYKVYYRATDSDGNQSIYTLTYIIKSKEYSRDQLMELIAAEAEAYGITSNMSKTQKVKKIYSYVQNKISWDAGESGIGESNIPGIDRANWENDWIEEAVRSLDSESGDCYSYYSLSKAFFEYFGIANEGIQRSKASGQEGTHFWNVVEVEEGCYYYDGTSLKGKFNDGTKNACLITQEKLDSYLTSHGEDDFYTMTSSDRSRYGSKVSKTPIG